MLSAFAGCQRCRTVFSQSLEGNLYPSTARHHLDKNAAYPKAIETLKGDETVPETTELRQKKYLNNIIEQDHRAIKRLTKAGMGFKSFNTARRTLRGYEAMNMVRKGQIQGVEKNLIGQISFIHQIFGVFAKDASFPRSFPSIQSFCNTTADGTQPLIEPKQTKAD